MRKSTIRRGAALALMVGGIFAVQSVQADVNYTFVDDGLTSDTPFDVSGIGAFETKLDDVYPINVTLTTENIRGMEGSLASEGTNNTMNVQGNADALGVNSANNPGAYDSESRDFNPGEAWMFSFNVPVELVEIDFSSQGAGARMTFSSTAFADIDLDDGSSNDIHDLGNILVPAGTVITLAMSNVPGLGADDSVRITDFTVAAIPEPGSLGLIGACAIGTFAIRRFRM